MEEKAGGGSLLVEEEILRFAQNDKGEQNDKGGQKAKRGHKGRKGIEEDRMAKETQKSKETGKGKREQKQRGMPEPPSWHPSHSRILRWYPGILNRGNG